MAADRKLNPIIADRVAAERVRRAERAVIAAAKAWHASLDMFLPADKALATAIEALLAGGGGTTMSGVSTTTDARTCLICKRRCYNDVLVKYGVRHYACARCFIDRDPDALATIPVNVLRALPLKAFDGQPRFVIDRAIARLRAET